ncbi:MAG: pilus assembly protein [Gomphosphaeria aponina SAG 52.96 = DSM 107014]|uniref:Pilus assembly protein n=1 Tax=Gomphosphaeria aponina SAG 52.96 = DSM 107014 TaxID=1521640 RepID=A0A941JUV9_9CHRO|nr:pilus assembly protein [Gomphosphaeria aponina SAG 52.96 = DSM 107014]
MTMTFSTEVGAEDNDFAQEYPTLFGITLTPKMSGILLGVFGLAGAGYIIMNMVLPAQASYKTLATDLQTKQAQVEQLKQGVAAEIIQEKEADLQKAAEDKLQVLALFSTAATLDTLLLDINQFIEGNNAKLISYTPGAEISIIDDGSLGDLVNGKLKRQTIELEIQGTYEKTQSVIRDIERLQPVLLVKNLSSNVSEGLFYMVKLDKGNQPKILPLPPILNTKFTLELLLPRSPEELAAEAAAAAPPPEGEQPPQ